MDARKKTYVFVFIKVFFHDFWIAKSSSLLSILKLNVPAIKEKAKPVEAIHI